jgi:hypothetical protein
VAVRKLHGARGTLVHVYTNWYRGWIYVYSFKTAPSTVCAPQVSCGSADVAGCTKDSLVHVTVAGFMCTSVKLLQAQCVHGQLTSDQKMSEKKVPLSIGNLIF